MVRIEIDELVGTFRPPQNGAQPTWCAGAPLLVRHGDDLIISIPETGEKVSPADTAQREKILCNTRWQLWQRQADVWQCCQACTRCAARTQERRDSTDWCQNNANPPGAGNTHFEYHDQYHPGRIRSIKNGRHLRPKRNRQQSTLCLS